MIEAPREQWLIDLRAELAERYPAEFIEAQERAIRTGVRGIAWAEWDKDDMIEELDDSFMYSEYYDDRWDD